MVEIRARSRGPAR